MKKGSPEGAPPRRGAAPLAGVWGCPPDIISTPSVEGSFLVRKGVRGMVDILIDSEENLERLINEISNLDDDYFEDTVIEPPPEV